MYSVDIQVRDLVSVTVESDSASICLEPYFFEVAIEGDSWIFFIGRVWIVVVFDFLMGFSLTTSLWMS